MSRDLEVKEDMVKSALSTLVGQRRVAFAETVYQAMDEAYNSSEVLQLAPFDLTDCELVQTKVPVLSVMMLGRNAKAFNSIVSSRPNFTSMLVDSHLRGKDALFILRTFSGARAGDVSTYVNRLTKANSTQSPGILIGRSFEGITPVAFQLKQLF